MYVRPKLTFVSFFLCFFFLNLPLMHLTLGNDYSGALTLQVEFWHCLDYETLEETKDKLPNVFQWLYWSNTLTQCISWSHVNLMKITWHDLNITWVQCGQHLKPLPKFQFLDALTSLGVTLSVSKWARHSFSKTHRK